MGGVEAKKTTVEVPVNSADSQARPCDKECTVQGTSGKCGARVQYYADHAFVRKPNACGLAHTRLIEQCSDECGQCTLAESRCVVQTPADFDCNAALNNWKAAWSHEKKSWCCQREHKGCDPATHSFPFDCNAGFSNWKNGWSQPKKAWCCAHGGRGCSGGLTERVYNCEA